MNGKTAVVAGATGVIGRALITHLETLEDWHIVGLCRRPPDRVEGRTRYLAVDLLDAGASRAALAGLEDATHLFYCAYTDRPSMAELVAPNLALLVNVVDGLEAAAKGLERAVLVEGTKWYGSHLGPFKTPAREDDPRCLPPMFYHDQEDTLRNRAEGRPWSWTALRPQTVCGFSLHSPMNIMTAIAVYATISKELGLPLRFPGKPGAYGALYQVAEAEHLARALAWAATAPAAAGEAFNVTNGDFFRWRNLWPRLAEFFGMPAGPVQTIGLTQMMADKEALWSAIAARHDLAPHPYRDLVAWPFADYVFGCDWDVMSSTTKIRQAGFPDVVDSEQMFLDLLTRFRAERIIP